MPHFIGLGAQKAATSWIHACLYEHPEAFLPASKEIHYFSRHFEKGEEWYARHFRDCLPEQKSGEISPTYLYDEKTPSRILEWNPRTKLIACLRDPVSRAVSAFRYEQKMGLAPEVDSIAEAFRSKPAYLEHGLYYGQLSRYLELFPREQLLVMLYEDIARDAGRFVQEIFSFVGLSPSFVPESLSQKINIGMGAPRFTTIDSALRGGAHALRNAGFGRFVWRVTRLPITEKVMSWNRRKTETLSLSEEERRSLVDYYAEDVARLSELLKMDLRRAWPTREVSHVH